MVTLLDIQLWSAEAMNWPGHDHYWKIKFLKHLIIFSLEDIFGWLLRDNRHLLEHKYLFCIDENTTRTIACSKVICINTLLANKANHEYMICRYVAQM